MLKKELEALVERQKKQIEKLKDRPPVAAVDPAEAEKLRDEVKRLEDQVDWYKRQGK